ncbi:MAG: phenylacetate--CoA ligase family protein [Candidatus Methanoperedens sp.]|nr:phenylacetate--CoA ligase family protein [Candidatus Methanoperedens sp.]CAG0951651.1 phenylacetate-CoA ligase [Methanosarcinales archaeon]
MFQKQLFILAHQLFDRNFYPAYKKLIQNQFKSYEVLKAEQEKQLKYAISYAYENVPYYHRLFRNLNLSPSDITKIDDLEKLPILTKEIVNQNFEDFKPVNLTKMKYCEAMTGGTTGIRFRYRYSKYDRTLSWALLYRGWGYGGFEFGDKMVFLQGSSLDFESKPHIIKIGHEIVRNMKMLSSFDLGEKENREYVNIINSLKPKFIRGYSSSIFFFSKWIEKNNIEIHQPLAIFTTSDMLYPIMRKKIEAVFNCKVFNNYGLNDGGISAFECSEHNGLHIDTERSIMEVVDKKGNVIQNGEGRVIATSLYNYAMPFIRWETGDLCHINDDICECGRGYKLLTNLLGKEQEILETPDGKYVHGGFFTHIFRYINDIKEFQIIQDKLDRIEIRLVINDGFDEKQLDRIKRIIHNKSIYWNVDFKYVEKIHRTADGKYKFIKNQIDLNNRHVVKH